MHVRVSGLPDLPASERPRLLERVRSLPRSTLERFARIIDDVAVHLRADERPATAAAHARVTVRRRQGGALVAEGLGPDPESAVRRALVRARRRLRKDRERRLALKS